MAGAVAQMAIPSAPRIEMVANPDFTFPMQPPSRKGSGDEVSKRPSSMHINLPPADSSFASHRRAVSTLPNFTFNATDTSGRQAGDTPPQTPDESAPITPSRRGGHRRGGSEFVGGDSRFGVSNAVSSSPTKSNALPLPVAATGPSPVGRRGHAHRRSAAISSHDVGNIMQSADLQPRLSNSLPNTPLDHSSDGTGSAESVTKAKVDNDIADPFGPPLDEAAVRPPSRPRVEFSDNVEIIPRPLSTISSETESSLSTVRGLHSHTGSINSIISLSTPSPPSSRVPRVWENVNTEDEVPTSKARSSLEISRRLENEGEGEWLKGRSSGSLKRPYSESSMAAPKTSFVLPEHPERARATPHNKKHSLSHALGFDRRRSEPTIGMNAGEPSRLSAISLQETASSGKTPVESEDEHDQDHDHISSARRLKQWAISKVSGKSREMHKVTCTGGRTTITRPVSEGGVPMSPLPSKEDAAIAETNLDAVFDIQTSAERLPQGLSQQHLEINTPTPSQHSSFHSRDNEDVNSPVLDLDAALGPFKTPPIGSYRHRKELHSSRQFRDFAGPGGHYHRRTESAPDLPPFENTRIGTPPQHAMADVFEEDEPEEEEMMLPPRSASIRSAAEDESGMGVQIVDSDTSMQDTLPGAAMDDGLGIMRGDWEPERPSTAYGNGNSGFFGIGSEPRATSVIEETIVEEVSPVEAIDIVEAHEEPRASSLTKSSDSSETPTIAAPTGVLTFPNGQSTLMTPATYQTSAFSSPDPGRRQSSFEASRLCTSASSLADNRTVSSCHTADHNELRPSVDDVPSLTSSRSTMLSTTYANNSRHNLSAAGRTPSVGSGAVDPRVAAERRRKRGSIQSLTQLVGSPFGSRSRGPDDARPHTSAAAPATNLPKKENRLKKLMFWKSKQHSKHPSSHEA